MDSIILSSVISAMVSRVISVLASQFRSERSMEAKLKTVHLQVIKIQSAVEEAAGRQITSQGLLDWLSELINGVYQGRYMLDMVRYGVAEAADPTEGNGDENNMSFSLSSYNPAKRLRVAVKTTKIMVLINNDVPELDQVLANLDLISKNLKEFIMLLGSHPPLVHRHITTSLYADCQMFGRYVERERIINILMHENSSIGQKLRILPIICRNGVGKSTLVQHVCADARVRNYFSPILLFGCYFVHSMVDAIEWNSDEPAQALKEKLFGKRFLIIFQNIDLQHAEQLKALLPSLMTGKHGSQMVITSNNKHVAGIGTTKPIILRDLPPAEYWFFFKAHAFGSRDIEEDHKLLTIGRAIARRLNGSFWGAKIVGGLLRASPTPRLWWKVLNNCDVWKLSLYGSGLGYINDVTSQLLLLHVKSIILSRLPF